VDGENCIVRSFNNLFYSTSVIKIVKSRKKRLKGYVARMEYKGMHIGDLLGSLRERETGK
jgi:hypothetical protein